AISTKPPSSTVISAITQITISSATPRDLGGISVPRRPELRLERALRGERIEHQRHHELRPGLVLGGLELELDAHHHGRGAVAVPGVAPVGDLAGVAEAPVLERGPAYALEQHHGIALVDFPRMLVAVAVQERLAEFHLVAAQPAPDADL